MRDRLIQGPLRPWQVLVGVIPALLMFLIVGALLVGRADATRGLDGSIQVYETRETPFTVTLSAAGSIEAGDQAVVTNEVYGSSLVLWVIPEGEYVEKGDLLVVLDSSRLEDRLVDQQIRVQQAEADYISAREAHLVGINRAESNIEQARLDLEFAEVDLRKFIEGDAPNRISELDARVVLAESEHATAARRLTWSQSLFERDYISSTELRADERAEQRARLDMELAQARRALFQEYEHNRRLTELRSNVRQTGRALERAEISGRADVIALAARESARERIYGRHKERLARIEQHIENTQIRAPQNGIVVYATSTQRGGGRHGTEPLSEGQTVWQNQELIHLPRTDTFMAVAAVHETSLDYVKVGMPVRLSVNALPGRYFTGRVASIAPLADSQLMWSRANPDLRIHYTEIEVTGDTQGLRIGMACRADIVLSRHERAIAVPVEAVVWSGETAARVYTVARGGRIQPREVQVGLENNRMVHVISGLEAGEHVVLTPPGKDDSAPARRPGIEARVAPVDDDTVRPAGGAAIRAMESRG